MILSRLSIEDTKNWQIFRRKLNAILDDIEAMAPGVGGALPSPTGQPEGRFFTVTGPPPELHQIVSGAWEQIA